jgi:hypothetical protein
MSELQLKENFLFPESRMAANIDYLIFPPLSVDQCSAVINSALQAATNDCYNVGITCGEMQLHECFKPVDLVTNFDEDIQKYSQEMARDNSETSFEDESLKVFKFRNILLLEKNTDGPDFFVCNELGEISNTLRKSTYL